jgi:hypothetical protein
MKELLRLYPKAWRARYEDEFLALMEQRTSSPLDAFDIVVGALDAHLRPQVSAAEVKPERRALVNSTGFARWSGLGSALGGILLVLGFAGQSMINDEEYPYTYGVGDVLMSLLVSASLILMLAGLAGLYARLGQSTGIFGQASLALAVIGGLALLAASLLHLAEILQLPTFRDWWNLLMIGFMLLLLGTSLFAIAGLRTRTLPKWGAVACMVGGLATLAILLLSILDTRAVAPDGQEGLGVLLREALRVSTLVFSLLFISGWVWLGYTLWSHKVVLPALSEPGAA